MCVYVCMCDKHRGWVEWGGIRPVGLNVVDFYHEGSLAIRCGRPNAYHNTCFEYWCIAMLCIVLLMATLYVFAAEAAAIGIYPTMLRRVATWRNERMWSKLGLCRAEAEFAQCLQSMFMCSGGMINHPKRYVVSMLSHSLWVVIKSARFLRHRTISAVQSRSFVLLHNLKGGWFSHRRLAGLSLPLGILKSPKYRITRRKGLAAATVPLYGNVARASSETRRFYWINLRGLCWSWLQNEKRILRASATVKPVALVMQWVCWCVSVYEQVELVLCSSDLYVLVVPWSI